jgi:hypothetical protein
MSCNLRLLFQNTTGRLRIIRLEPWARHFLLGPDEKLAIIARAADEHPSFRMVEATDTTLVYTEGCDRVHVIQDDMIHELFPVYEIEAAPVQSAHLAENPMFDRDLDMF